MFFPHLGSNRVAKLQRGSFWIPSNLRITALSSSAFAVPTPWSDGASLLRKSFKAITEGITSMVDAVDELISLVRSSNGSRILWCFQSDHSGWNWRKQVFHAQLQKQPMCVFAPAGSGAYSNCCSTWCSRLAGMFLTSWPSCCCTSCYAQYAWGEHLKWLMMCLPVARMSVIMRCANNPSWTACWRVCSMHGKVGNPASRMAFAMFAALSRSTTWTLSLRICHVWSMLSYFVTSTASVCELGDSCACRTAILSVSPWNRKCL